jgi:hypothetical protein
MLIELSGENFGCFRDAFKLSLLASDIDPSSTRGVVAVTIDHDDEPLRLLKTIALYGANGSGKSTLIRAAGALRHLLSETRSFASDTPLQPYEPFALGPQHTQPVKLGVKAVIDGRVYDYSVSFLRREFITEELAIWKGVTREVLLMRSRAATTGLWTTDPQFELLTRGYRPNALLLSLADSLAPNLAQGIAVGLRQMLTTSDASATALPLWHPHRAEAIAKRLREDEAFSVWLLARLRAADVGVADLRTDEVRTIIEVDNDDEDESDSPDTRQEVRTSYRLMLLHHSTDGTSPISYHRESLGTRRMVEMGPLLYDLSHNMTSRAAFIDEFDASIHPLLLQELVRHFNDSPDRHSRSGQLIFATHETSLLDAEAKDAPLRRDQIYFTEKDSTGASRLYSVAEFKERNNLNIRRRYLQGRYGALPSLGVMPE